MGENVAHVRGIKMSLLDADQEIAVRSRLPEGTTLFTGDDFNYVASPTGREHWSYLSSPRSGGTPTSRGMIARSGASGASVNVWHHFC